MDPLSQGVFGALPAQIFGRDKNLGRYTLIGTLAGMAPDLDVLIRSSEDSLLGLEYHRHFTHSLIFIPVSAFIVALLLKALFFRSRFPLKKIYLAALFGTSTHGLLDACTSYGTQLFWPFTNYRVSWDVISIIDPLLTLPLIALAAVAVFRKKSAYSIAAAVYACLYLTFGFVQQNRAQIAGLELAQSRGHDVTEIEAKPSLGNLVLWKVFYIHEGFYFVDAVRVGMESKYFEGESIEVLDLERDFPWLEKGSTHAKDIERFRWFSQGYIAKDPRRENVIVDVRYSMLPDSTKALWGIELFPNRQSEHVLFQNFRQRSDDDLDHFLSMLFDRR